MNKVDVRNLQDYLDIVAEEINPENGIEEQYRTSKDKVYYYHH